MNWAIALLGCAMASSGAMYGQTAGNIPGALHTVVVPQLPTPSGPFGIGRVGYDWTDNARSDRYSTDLQAHRELMVYLWYPISQKAADTKGTYLPAAKEMDATPDIQHSMQQEFEANWPLIVSGTLTSHVRDGAPIAKSPKRFPVVFFSHGSGGTSFESTSLIEDLVSHGYVVVAIEHTYTAIAVAFSNGKIVPFHQEPVGLTPEQRFQRMMEQAAAGIKEGAADIRFVLDKLTELNGVDTQHFLLAGRLDLNDVAAMGHSAGGAFIARACQLDERFKACVDLDGTMVPVAALPDYSDDKTMKQPLLLLEVYHPESRMGGTHAQIEDYFKKKEAQLQSCPAGSYDVVLKSPGIFHGSFSDYPLLAAAGNANATAMALHNLHLVQIFARAFLDKYLKHETQPLFQSQEYLAEATIQQYPH
jgi:dienelactone hydrolase